MKHILFCLMISLGILATEHAYSQDTFHLSDFRFIEVEDSERNSWYIFSSDLGNNSDRFVFIHCDKTQMVLSLNDGVTKDAQFIEMIKFSATNGNDVVQYPTSKEIFQKFWEIRFSV